MTPLLDDVLALLGLVVTILIIGLCLVAFAPDIAAAVTADVSSPALKMVLIHPNPAELATLPSALGAVT